jgi:hypothetical protein
MSVFENRTGAYVWVREDRKRRKLAFSAQPELNGGWSEGLLLDGLVGGRNGEEGGRNLHVLFHIIQREGEFGA